MKATILFLPLFTMAQVCPHAIPSTAECIGTKAILAPYINPGSYSGSPFTFTWSWTGTPILSGAATATLTTNTGGVYTLTVRSTVNPTCITKSSHTVTGCQTVGISEVELDQVAPVYFDLYGRAVTAAPGIILIEQRGTIRRKIVITD